MEDDSVMIEAYIFVAEPVEREGRNMVRVVVFVVFAAASPTAARLRAKSPVNSANDGI